ncbi:MAG: bifunctional DNA-formamidopyrimidine glycosylase/DNA-(apurinic or apyrimidinic site) lyase [Candidatus Aminicenantes bacterium]|nr:bifunctional DNA-formamidopyrimidine glycosylase/DNA-(apurinic or apyrimidinic site) lyase [Candidatus Aminicenantes bacterium]
MPELPEVETIARGLEPRLRGRAVAAVELLHRPLLRRGGPKALAALKGRRILGVRRRGKMLFIELEGRRTLVFHLKMTGQFLFSPAAEPRDKHTRLVLRFEDGRDELRFHDIRKFGFLLCVDGDPACACGELAALGPEPLEIGLPDFAALLKQRRARIKALLLDQTALAGIGNIYADEMLFDAGIHPRKPASALSRAAVGRLHAAMRKILTQAIAEGGSTLQDFRDAEGREGNYQDSHMVYGRAGEPCPVCGSAIRRIIVAGRGTHFCPRCQ